jgi:hypothetical protein
VGALGTINTRSAAISERWGEDHEPEPAACDALVDLPAQAVSDAELELVVPGVDPAVPQRVREGTHHLILVLGRVGYEHVELAILEGLFRELVREGEEGRVFGQFRSLTKRSRRSG